MQIVKVKNISHFDVGLNTINIVDDVEIVDNIKWNELEIENLFCSELYYPINIISKICSWGSKRHPWIVPSDFSNWWRHVSSGKIDSITIPGKTRDRKVVKWEDIICFIENSEYIKKTHKKQK